MRERVKWMLFPGINLHTRQRYRILPQYLEAAPGSDSRLLDAGCGNGMLSYQAFLRGYRVTGISFKEAEVERCKKFFNVFLHIPEERLQFRVMNLYDVELLDQPFDEIVCTEVLEHLKKDDAVCRSFFKLLKPGGAAHICCPNADHPYNRSFPLDPGEKGGMSVRVTRMKATSVFWNPQDFTLWIKRASAGLCASSSTAGSSGFRRNMEMRLPSLFSSSHFFSCGWTVMSPAFPIHFM